MTSALTAASDIETECSAADVTWANPNAENSVCAGPITYELWATEVSPSSLCGAGSCPQNKTCSKTFTTVEDSSPEFNIGDICEKPPGGNTQCELNESGAGQECRARRETRVTQINANGWTVTNASSKLVGPISQPGPQSHRWRCDISITYDKSLSGPWEECGCATLPVFPTCEHATTRTRSYTSAPGLTKAQVRANHDVQFTPARGQSAGWQITPVCRTGEDEVDLVKKLTRLLAYHGELLNAFWAGVPNVVPQLEEVTRRSKVTYELLDNQQASDSSVPHDYIHNGLYGWFPDVEPACGRHAPAVPPSCPIDAAVYAKLHTCARLTSLHIKVGPTRGALFQRLYDTWCPSGLEAVRDQVAAGKCQDVAEPVLDMQRRALDKSILRLGYLLNQAPSSDNSGLIADTLHRIDKFFRSASTLVAPGRAGAELDLLANKFWQVGYGHKLATDDTEWYADSTYDFLAAQLTAAEGMPAEAARALVENALQNVDARGLKLDREVLKAAYGNVQDAGATVPTTTGAPLLRFTADSLAPMVERLESLVQFHDVGCALAQCAAFSTPTKLSRFWKVLARLTAAPGASPSLGDVLAATPTAALGGWKPTFQALADAQARLLTALSAEPPFVASGTWPQGGAAVDLSALLDQATTRTRAYEATGTFLAPVGDTLNSGVHAAQRDRIKDDLVGLARKLNETQTTVDGQLVQLVNGLVRVREGETALAQLNATRDRIESEVNNLRARDAGFRALLATGGSESEGSIFENLMKEWATVSGAADTQDYLRVGSSTDLLLSGSLATFNGWSGKTVDDVKVHKVPMQAGQALSVTIADGQWAPSCALRDVGILSPAGEDLRLDGIGAPTGPEGYTINWTGSTFSASSTNTALSARVTAGFRGEVCTQADFLVASAKGCFYTDVSASAETSKGWQHGGEKRTSAQFSSGLFVLGTPFEAAAGSLVVVEMPPGDTNPDHILDVHLVHAPHTTIVVDQAADLYLAINDIRCEDQDSAHKLHVKVATYVSTGNAAEALVKRMAHTIALVRARRPGLLARGEILPSESSEIQLQAKLDAISSGGAQIPVDDYPVAMRDLFYKHLATEMTRLEAEIRMTNIGRELAIKQAEYSAATLAIKNAEMSGYLLALLPKWNVRGLRLKQLRGISTEYVQEIHGFLAPLLKVWYPSVFNGLGSVEALQSLAGVDLDTPLTLMTGWLSGLGDELDLRIRNVELPYPPPQETAPTVVALRFVKPSQLDPSCANSPSARCPRIGMPGAYRWATTAQSKALWAAIGDHSAGENPSTVRHIVFHPSPDDLYQPTAGLNYLPCSRSLPVVRKIGVALTGIAASRFPPEQRLLESYIPESAPMAFPDAVGSHSFVLDNPAWLQLASVPLIYTNNDYTRVASQLAAFPQDVRGVSPFTTFVFDLTENLIDQWILRDGGTIDLLFEVEAIRSTSIVKVPSCSSSTASSLAADLPGAVDVGAGE